MPHYPEFLFPEAMEGMVWNQEPPMLVYEPWSSAYHHMNIYIYIYIYIGIHRYIYIYTFIYSCIYLCLHTMALRSQNYTHQTMNSNPSLYGPSGLGTFTPPLRVFPRKRHGKLQRPYKCAGSTRTMALAAASINGQPPFFQYKTHPEGPSTYT